MALEQAASASAGGQLKAWGPAQSRTTSKGLTQSPVGTLVDLLKASSPLLTTSMACAGSPGNGHT